jgi:antitoxin CcdA
MSGSGIEDAIARAGGVARLGERLGVAHSQVVRWRKAGFPPAGRVAAIEAATGVPRARLRPDLYPSGFGEAQAALVPKSHNANLPAVARALGLDPDAIAATALRKAISDEKARRWREENKEAIEAWNRWTEENELPLAKYRMF